MAAMRQRSVTEALSRQWGRGSGHQGVSDANAEVSTLDSLAGSLPSDSELLESTAGYLLKHSPGRSGRGRDVSCWTLQLSGWLDCALAAAGGLLFWLRKEILFHNFNMGRISGLFKVINSEGDFDFTHGPEHYLRRKQLRMILLSDKEYMPVAVKYWHYPS